MATNKRGWHIPTITLPRIRFGSGQERKDDPAMTYYLVILPALLLSVFGLIMGFSAQTVTAIAQGENPYTAYARPLIIILASLVIATIVLLVPQRWLMHVAPVMFVGALVFQSLVLSPLGRSEGGNANWVKVGPIMAQPSEFLKLALIVFLGFMVSKSASKRGDWKAMSVAVGLPILTALGAVADKVKGLRGGAEDYIVKPFEPVELLARIEVVLRRAGKSEMHLRYGDIQVDIEKHTALKNGVPVALTPKEFDVLVFFMRNPDVAITREQLLSNIWGFDFTGESRSVDIHVQQVRRKMGLQGKLITIPKLGYRLERR